MHLDFSTAYTVEQHCVDFSTYVGYIEWCKENLGVDRWGKSDSWVCYIRQGYNGDLYVTLSFANKSDRDWFVLTCL